MKRKLILIISDGGPSAPLSGVHKDKENYLNFFKSPYGGAWKEEEIHVFDKNNFYVQALRNFVLTANSEYKPYDFFLIVYCGHGDTDPYGNIRFHVKEDCDIMMDEILEVVRKTRCLLIADSCRSVVKLQEGGRIGNTRLFSAPDANEEAYAELCRDMYNKHILSSPFTMHTILFSNSFNEEAMENPNGGYYSYSLLNAAKDFIMSKHSHLDDGEDFLMNILQAHEQARLQVEKLSKGMQHPEIVECSRTICQFPFVVIPNWQKQCLD